MLFKSYTSKYLSKTNLAVITVFILLTYDTTI